MEFDALGIIDSWMPTLVTAIIVGGLYYVASRMLKSGDRKTNFVMIRAISLFTITLVGFIFIILAAPISSTVKGQITNLFGIIISAGLAISSATFITNALAGIMLRSVDNYKVGDFLRVGDVFGRVTVRGFFHTEIQSEDRDLITLPNSHLVNNPVKVVRASGTFISGLCSLGYDVNHNDIKHALLKAIEQAGLEEGYVQVKELGDYSVVYQAFGLLKDCKTIISSRTKLYTCMLDCLHEANIEIVSPSFMNQRQVDKTVFIPKKTNKGELVQEREQIENVIFDKADEAESIEQIKENLGEVEAEIKKLQEELKSLNTDEDKKSVQAKIDQYESQKAKIAKTLSSKEDDLKSKD